MNIEKLSLIPLPEGESGSYLITQELLDRTGNDLTALDDVIKMRAVQLGMSLRWTVSQERRGFRVTWRPQ